MKGRRGVHAREGMSHVREEGLHLCDGTALHTCGVLSERVVQLHLMTDAHVSEEVLLSTMARLFSSR